MKPILIATAIVAAAGIAIVQHFKLFDLNTETAMLEAGRTTSSPKRADRSVPETETKRDATAEQIEVVREAMIEALVAYRDRRARLDPERTKQFLFAARDFSGRDIARVIKLLDGDSRLSGLEADKILEAYHHNFSEVAPFAWREYLEANRDLPDWQKLFDFAVTSCLHADGKRAIDQFEEESARGNRDFATSGIRTGVLLALAASDPDKMLAMATSPEFTADPDALALLGGFAANKIGNPADHQRFLTAMRRAQERNPSPVLEKIRQDYVSGIGRRMNDWPPADAISLIDSGLTPDERFSTAAILANRFDLNDAEKWIDWFLRIDPKEWAAWTERTGTRERHPLVEQIQGRSYRDAQTAGGWLAKIPPGPLRDEATLSHAWMIADRDPDRAAGYLAELPESKGKRNLAKKIGAARR
jgi:hypothetical protein